LINKYILDYDIWGRELDPINLHSNIRTIVLFFEDKMVIGQTPFSLCNGLYLTIDLPDSNVAGA